MKHTKQWFLIAAGLIVFSACQKEKGENHEENDNNNHVYSTTNSAKGNLLIDYRRAENGVLTYDSAYPTGGIGTGAGLGSQGAVAMTEDGIVLAVNAGSHSISSFKRLAHGLVLRSTVSSGGVMPISLTEYHHVVFVLNGGGTGNISGFSLADNGKLSAIPNSTRPLSTGNSGPAQVSFVNDGRALVVTEKSTNTLTSYASNGTMHTLPSAHPTPFGFATGANGNIFVSEAAGGAAGASTLSSYHIDNNGILTLLAGPVANMQSAACWVAMTGNGKYAYTTNTSSNNISTYDINSHTGSIKLGAAIAAGTGQGPIDAAFSSNSKYLYILTPGSNTINCFKVLSDGSLSASQTIDGVAGSAAGLAAQ